MLDSTQKPSVVTQVNKIISLTSMEEVGFIYTLECRLKDHEFSKGV